MNKLERLWGNVTHANDIGMAVGFLYFMAFAPASFFVLVAFLCWDTDYPWWSIAVSIGLAICCIRRGVHFLQKLLEL